MLASSAALLQVGLLLVFRWPSYLCGATSSQLLDCTNHSSTCTGGGPEIGLSSRTDDGQTGCFSQPDSSGFGREFSFVCTALAATGNRTSDPKETGYGKEVSVYIAAPQNGRSESSFGRDLLLKCKFNTSTRQQDLRFRLRWMRLVAGAQGNQSIVGAPAQLRRRARRQVLWKLATVQQEDGLDLELRDFQAPDVGSYYCQAHSADGSRLLSEASVELANANWSQQLEAYSLDNLSKLLPSLQVLPRYSEASAGQQFQLACTTTGTDPSPADSQLEWSFAQVSQREGLLRDEPQFVDQLPPGTSRLENLLVIWSLSEAASGLYRCRVQLTDFNLTASAYGEVYLSSRETRDEPPQVLVSPEVVTLSANGSAQIQCEASGHPTPELVWYRIEETSPSMSRVASLMEGELEGVYVEQVAAADVSIYCARDASTRCQLQRQHFRRPTSAISVLELVGARAKHQGQYVCRAENRLGSSQASSVVDVEFRETPRVQIPADFRKQTIWLGALPSSAPQSNLSEASQQRQAAEFRCLLEAGKPEPRLRWLRLGQGAQSMVQALRNLDLYDLAKASSATSRVTVERLGRELVLQVSTISVEDEGAYVCLAENEWGRHSQVARLVVRRPARISILQASPLIAHLNSSFQLECLASGHPSPLDLEWSRFDRGTFFSLISHGSGEERAVLKFDRATADDSGEYTCNARDPLDSGAPPLRDLVLVSVVEPLDSRAPNESSPSLLPRLIVRPSKSTVKRGANLTLDCLAVSGLQPTIVEWIAPARSPNNATVTPYYRDPGSGSGQLLQLGSKLKIFQVEPEHEGVYQCKGRNKAGVEVAPALVRVLQSRGQPEAADKPVGSSEASGAHLSDSAGAGQPKTKLARAGSNIELKCQVAGEDQVATSWSRNNLELPANSVQIEHNLWIHNVSQLDGGLYLCSARAEQSNKIYHARIQLLVAPAPLDSSQASSAARQLYAKIIASKSQLELDDSLTLECLVSSANNTQADNPEPVEEHELELNRQVFWTNAKTGQSIFLDNVYIQGNLLIVYQIRPQNEGVYRCNYNELAQSVDYRLQIHTASSAGSESAQPEFVEGSKKDMDIRKVPLGGYLQVECPQATNTSFWTRGQDPRVLVKPVGHLLELINLQTSEADLYQCWTGLDQHQSTSGQVAQATLVVQVLVPATRFGQRAPSSSYLTFPDTPGAHNEFSVELKFYAEQDTGLILYSGQWSKTAPADYVALYLSEGHLEFKFELGDGPTVLRSRRAVQLNQWHWASISQNKFGASMRVDRQQAAASSNSSRKYLNLNLESVVYVGGGPAHLLESLASLLNNTQGFRGCLSQLWWAGKQLNISRAVSVEVSECDKPECEGATCLAANTAACQVETGSDTRPDRRCICAPGFTGDRCQLAVGEEQVLSKPVTHSCDSLAANCSAAGSSGCQLLSSSSYKCHCRLGFGGSNCSEQVKFAGNETSVRFADQSYLKLHLNQAHEALAYLERHEPEAASRFNGSAFGRQLSMVDSQNVSLRLLTNSSYGILFYTGSHTRTERHLKATGRSSASGFPGPNQPSKSMVANLLARLSPAGSVVDYLALALIDGHVELSYELGSGVAVIRSSQRVNDLAVHQIRVLRTGKLARLLVDELHRYEGAAPGKLSALNGPNQVYLGGLPWLVSPAAAEDSPLASAVGHRLAAFSGCISHLELNSLGPLNLVAGSQVSRLEEARNLGLCAAPAPPLPAEEQQLVNVNRPAPVSEPPEPASEPDDADET